MKNILFLFLFTVLLFAIGCAQENEEGVNPETPVTEVLEKIGNEEMISSEEAQEVKEAVIKEAVTKETEQKSDCPQFTPPHPDWCKNGKVVPGGTDENGCKMHPKCLDY